MLFGSKGGKHPRTLWRDEQLNPTRLENNVSIFDIIMPWVAEKKEED